jgi:hypothetical protein
VFKFISKSLSIPHLIIFIAVALGAVKVYGYPVTIFLVFTSFFFLRDRFVVWNVINKQSLIWGFWALTLSLITFRGLDNDLRVLFVFIQTILIFFIAARFSLIDLKQIDFQMISKSAFAGTLVSFIAYFIFSYANNGDDQENFMGSSALASYAIFVIGMWYLFWIYNSKESISLLIISFGIFSFLFGRLDSRYWIILVFCVPLIVFFTPRKFIGLKRRIYLAACVFIVGFSLFFAGNYTISSIANSQKLNLDTVIYKLENPFRQAKNYLVEHQLIDLTGINDLIKLKTNNEVLNTIDGDFSSCFIFSDVTIMSLGKTATSHDTERFVEPLIGNLMWYKSGLENFLLGNGLYSSKTEMISCMSLYYSIANKKVVNNIGVYRGNTATTFLYEFGILGLLCLAFTILSLLRFFLIYPVLILVFSLLLFQAFITSIYYAFSFLFPFYLFILKGAYGSQTNKY